MELGVDLAETTRLAKAAWKTLLMNFSHYTLIILKFPAQGWRFSSVFDHAVYIWPCVVLWAEILLPSLTANIYCPSCFLGTAHPHLYLR